MSGFAAAREHDDPKPGITTVSRPQCLARPRNDPHLRKGEVSL
jgi:hypothetical protein